MPRQRKMVNLDVEETSGVDHPAHLHEGWVVIKSATTDDVNGIFGDAAPVKKGNDVPEIQLEDVVKAKDAAEARVAELEAQVATLAKAAEPKTDPQEELLKSLPETLRKQFEEQAEALRKSQEIIEKERDARLDAECITKSKTVYKSLAIEHDTVAPALRRVAADHPELVEAIETALRAADAQVEAGHVLEEQGSNGNEGAPSEAAQAIETAAKSLLKDGVAATKEQAIAKAFEMNPELANRYFAEKEN